MIKTVPFDIPANFIIGMFVALAAPQSVRLARNGLINQYFLGVVVFGLLFFIPLGAYLYFFYPDWSLMYFIDPAGFSPLTDRVVGLAALAGYMLALAGGFAVASLLIRRDEAPKAWIILAVVAAALAVFSLITMDRLLQVGSFAEWTADPQATVSLLSHRINAVIAAGGLAMAAALFIMIRSYRGTVS